MSVNLIMVPRLSENQFETYLGTKFSEIESWVISKVVASFISHFNPFAAKYY